MAAVAVSSHSAPSLLRLSRISSSSSPSRFPFPSIRSHSYSHLFSTVTCRRAAAPSFPPLTRSRGRCITAFVDLDEAPYALTDDPPFEDVEVVEDIKVVGDLGGGVAGNREGDGFGGGDDGGGGGDDGGGGEGGEREGEGESGKKKKGSGMSMSQKLTLGYAALVGVGGVMGYMKSGSQKSLAAGGGSALLLYYVYTQLPVRPAFASSLGLGLSAALLAVMGSRFKRSGKIFPAGVVSIVSFIMAGGYFHGILRSLHA